MVPKIEIHVLLTIQRRFPCMRSPGNHTTLFYAQPTDTVLESAESAPATDSVLQSVLYGALRQTPNETLHNAVLMGLIIE